MTDDTEKPSTEIKDFRDYQLKKLSLLFSFIKFLIGTIALSILTIILNHQIQKKELEIKEKEQQEAYIAKFVEIAMQDNLEKRLRFAHYFSSILKDNWILYYNDLKEEFNEKKSEQLTFIKKSDEATDPTLKWFFSDKAKVVTAEITPDYAVGFQSDVMQQFEQNKTDELALSRLGESAFNRRDFASCITILEQAKAVSSSKVWESSYPFLIGSCYQLGYDEKGNKYATEMIDEMDVPNSYLHSPITIGFTLKNLGTTKKNIDQKFGKILDELIDRSLEKKKQLSQ